jgi:uncharacterized protein
MHVLSSEEPKALIQLWLEQAIIGLQLCPFAAPVVKAGRLRYASSAVTGFDEALREALAEVSLLLETPREEVSTTLLIFTEAFTSFEDFVEATDTLDEMLLASGAASFLQLATFHPLYQFEGEPRESISHYTNRAPFPIFHLLRVEEVSEAIDSFPDTLQIPKNNIKRLEALGREEVLSRWRRLGVK